MNDTSVLIVEDEFLIAEMLTAMIEDLGLRVCGRAANAQDAVRLAKAHDPALVLMDVRLQGEEDGVDAAIAIYKLALSSLIIFITGSREPETVIRIAEDHAAGTLFKPFRFEELRDLVHRLLKAGR